LFFGKPYLPAFANNGETLSDQVTGQSGPFLYRPFRKPDNGLMLENIYLFMKIK